MSEGKTIKVYMQAVPRHGETVFLRIGGVLLPNSSVRGDTFACLKSEQFSLSFS